ncbi:MAG: 30S ribosomal protein S12 methylthiotransferase RimO [Anaerovoracaceae bacterium]|jgi:ribosomal protein S12 methylthiotransferase
MKVFFDTLGCMKNFADSEAAAGMLEKAGHTIAEFPEDADVIVVNTCGFIEDAKRESISEIFEMARYRDEGKKLIVSGCMAQRYAGELFNEIPEADGFLGVNDYAKLPEMIDQLADPDGERIFLCHGAGAASLEDDMAYRKIPEHPYSTFLRIAEGCDNYCTYCVIPEIRGPYRSRSMESIVGEAERLAASGCRELVLIAQDTSYYGMDRYGKLMLPELLRRLVKIDGIRWIRLMYCYQDRITEELIETIATEEKVCDYIDIPIQHASDKVLREMNRRSTRQSLEETITALRRRIPDIHIRTTLIVGFPGETDEDFEELLDFVKKMRFERLGVFEYSQEEGTPAAARDDQIPKEIKEERLDRIMTEQMTISREKNEELIGQVLPVIVDELDDDGSCIGRTIYDAPEIDNSVIFIPVKAHEPGDITSVRILDAFDYDLEGREVTES